MPCYAEGNKETRDLAQAARLDSLAVLAMPRAFYPRAAPSDPHLLEVSACLASAERSGFVDIYADAAENMMSPGELRAARLFFETSTGRKYADFLIWQARAEFGLGQVVPAPRLSRKEEEHIARFLTSSAGIKITQRIFVDMPTPVRVYKLAAQIVSDCVARQGR